MFENVRANPGMYIPNATYEAVAAFVLGYDIACEGGVLVGFREWLIPRVGTPGTTWAGRNLRCIWRSGKQISPRYANSSVFATGYPSGRLTEYDSAKISTNTTRYTVCTSSTSISSAWASSVASICS